MPIAHIFALTLYYAAVCNTEKNWLNTHELIDLTPIERYVYSLYFAFTTMLTVGYGDITPSNIP
jgi:potassium voltage-gated channel Eag-related subfamily H protein 5/cyclic nucleotide gated channel alpha 1